MNYFTSGGSGGAARTKHAWRSGRATKMTKRYMKDVEIGIIFDKYSGKTR